MIDLSEIDGLVEGEAPVIRELPPLDPDLVLHVDGDMLCYECAGNDEVTQGEARRRLNEKVGQLMARSGAGKCVLHVTHPASHKGWRAVVSTVKPYQGNRSASKKPKNHGYLQDYLLDLPITEEKRSKVWRDREADDGIAACAYFSLTKHGKRIAIATQDKDMRMLPGLHVDWKSGELIEVELGAYDVVGPENGKQYGTKWFWLQMLMGDAADHIPGLEKAVLPNAKGIPTPKLCGEKTAIQLLAKCKNNLQAFREVYGLYLEYYGEHLGNGYAFADDRFCEQAALLWMRTDFAGSVDNFAKHQGPGSITEGFPAELHQAAGRLRMRVEKAIAEANAHRA